MSMKFLSYYKNEEAVVAKVVKHNLGLLLAGMKR